MLRIAVPNKGSLSEPASQMLVEAGYRQRTDSRELVLLDADNDAEFFFLRPRDIAVYVGSGRLDVGITGEDLLLDSGAAAESILQLGFAGSTFRFAGRPDGATSVRDLAGKRIATAYPGVVQSYLAAEGVAADVIRLDGAVETAVRLDVADVIADVVSTGTTLRNAGLEIFGDPILTSQAVLIRRSGTAATAKVDQLVRRLQGVIIARQYVLMDYDISDDLVELAVAITPGIESPTVSPLHEKGWSAVRSMVKRKQTNAIMDELWELGARGIIVTDIHACRVTAMDAIDVRPKVMARIGYAAAAFVFVVFLATAIVMPRANAGAHFGVKDQAGTAVLGLIVGALFLMLTHPRLHADLDAVRLRSFLGGWRTVPWDVIEGVDFPSKLRFARLLLPGDETLAIYAVQRLDKTEAVEAMRRLRALHAATRSQ